MALANQTAGLRAAMTASAMHQHQRDGAAWFTEWMIMPQLVLGCAASLQTAKTLSETLLPDVARMKSTLTDGLGLLQAEALSFALAEQMPRPQAQAAVKDLCARAMAEDTPLADLARDVFPTLSQEALNPMSQLGQAPAEARRFAARVKAFG